MIFIIDRHSDRHSSKSGILTPYNLLQSTTPLLTISLGLLQLSVFQLFVLGEIAIGDYHKLQLGLLL